MTASPSDNAGTLRPSVRVMTLDDVKEVAESLAAAFDDDPVWEFLVPAPSTRKTRMATIFRTMIRLQHLPHSTSYTDLERLSGALWDPPGHWRMTPSQQMRGTPGFIRGFGANLVTSLRTLSAVERAHPKGPHY